MRLITKTSFKDYYDSCVGYGIDPLVVYVRERASYSVGGYSKESDQVLESVGFKKAIKKLRIPNGLRFSFDSKKGVTPAFVGFCGRIYPAVSVVEKTPEGYFYDPQLKTMTYKIGSKKMVILHSVDEVDHYCQHHPENSALSKLACDKSLADFFQPVEELDAFVMADAPVIAYADSEYHVNPRLLDFRFDQVIDGIQAFQEISAFISGTLYSAKQTAPLPITDRQRAATKGFDDLSFRKRKN